MTDSGLIYTMLNVQRPPSYPQNSTDPPGSTQLAFYMLIPNSNNSKVLDGGDFLLVIQSHKSDLESAVGTSILKTREA